MECNTSRPPEGWKDAPLEGWKVAKSERLEGFTPHHKAPRRWKAAPHSPHHTTPYSLQSPYSLCNAVHGQLVHTTPQDVLERLTQSTAHNTEQTTTPHSLNHSSTTRSTATYIVAYIGCSTEHRTQNTEHRTQRRTQSTAQSTQSRAVQICTENPTTPYRESHHTTQPRKRKTPRPQKQPGRQKKRIPRG